MSDSEKKKNPSGGFFAIDRRTWGAICGQGEMGPTVAYLVLAQGTGQNNLATSWSVTSLKTWTGIDWDRGKVAIQKLIESGFIGHGEKHTAQRPRYELKSWSDALPAILERKRSRLSDYDRMLLAEVSRGQQPTKQTRSTRKRLDEMVQGGMLFKRGDSYTVAPPAAAGNGTDDLIWLPNSLVLGTEKGEESPIRRVRSSGDIWTLRLLVDLYHAQNLRADGGISPKVIKQIWERKGVGQQGIFNVWAFKPAHNSLWWAGPFSDHRSRPKEKEQEDHPVWENISQLRKQGLLSFVPHLWESERPDAEPLHAYGIRGIGGEGLEIEIGDAAHLAGTEMGMQERIARAEAEGFTYLAPIKNTLPDAQMIGVARLAYRPHTKRTADWWRELQAVGQIWLREYQRMYEEPEKLPAVANG